MALLIALGVSAFSAPPPLRAAAASRTPLLTTRCHVSMDGGQFVRKAVKQSLLTILELAEKPLLIWKQEKEEDRLLLLIDDAEAIRKQAAAKKLTAAKISDDALETSSLSWRAFIPMAQTRAEEKAAKLAEREARKEAGKAALKATATAAVGAAFTVAAHAAEAAAGPERLPSSDMSAEDRSAGRKGAGRSAAGAARRLINWARRTGDSARSQANAEAQRLRMAGLEEDLSLLGLTLSEDGKLITDRQLRKARRARSRQLHPDALRRRPRDEDQGSIYALNEAYDKVRKRL